MWGEEGRFATVSYGAGRDALQHHAMPTVCLEVDAEQPVHSDARCGYDDDVESYVVDGFHVSSYCDARR